MWMASTTPTILSKINRFTNRRSATSTITTLFPTTTMDKLMDLAMGSLSEYTESQESVKKTGGEEYNHHGGSQGIQSELAPTPEALWPAPDKDKVDHEKAAQVADHHSGSSGTTDLFSRAMSFVGSEKHTAVDKTDVDEDHITESHKKAYEHDQASSLDAHSLGSAAAVQVLKSFTSGGGSSGDVQSQLMGQAMAEALKLFENSGAQGDKQDAVNGAAMTMMKLMVKSKFSGGGTMGGHSSTSTLMSLASKFM